MDLECRSSMESEADPISALRFSNKLLDSTLTSLVSHCPGEDTVFSFSTRPRHRTPVPGLETNRPVRSRKTHYMGA